MLKVKGLCTKVRIARLYWHACLHIAYSKCAGLEFIGFIGCMRVGLEPPLELLARITITYHVLNSSGDLGVFSAAERVHHCRDQGGELPLSTSGLCLSKLNETSMKLICVWLSTHVTSVNKTTRLSKAQGVTHHHWTNVKSLTASPTLKYFVTHAYLAAKGPTEPHPRQLSKTMGGLTSKEYIIVGCKVYCPLAAQLRARLRLRHRAWLRVIVAAVVIKVSLEYIHGYC